MNNAFTTTACVVAIMSLPWSAFAAAANGEVFPSKPIRFVTSAIGSSGDLSARVIAQGLSASIGKPVVVENRAIVAIETAANAAPDGHTVLVYGSPLWLAPFLRENPSWDIWRDFAAITLAIRSPNVLVVHPSVAAKTTPELIALAKAMPGKLNYGSGSSGSSTHLAAELFKSMAGVNIVRIPYKGVGQALGDAVAGQLQVIMPNTGAAMVHVRSGRLRGLAVGSPEPSLLAPGLPTISASGVPGYEASAMSAMFVPRNTPPTIVNVLNRETVRILNQAEVREKFLSAGGETVGGSPAGATATIKAEMARMGKMIKEVGIREE
jgi:tripartite-type tricarboxylate transporter receptor subunit TctC